jgi:signal transduction histidine kinase
MTGWEIGDSPLDRHTSWREAGAATVLDDVFSRKDGSTFPVECTTTPIQEGSELAAVIVFRDVTERRQSESERARLVQELRDAVRVRDDFLSIASHELRTPLTPLRLLAQKAHRTGNELATEEPRVRRWIGELAAMEKHVGRLEKLVDGLLDVSRISAGRLVLEPEEVDLREIVREAVMRLRDELERGGYTLTLPETAIVSRWDRLRLDQVFTNLLSNALKYGAGKAIEIEVSSDARRARVCVKDHGIGIPLEDQDRIFERFERLAPIRHFGGFGLGLWIVKQVARAHGGEVRVESTPNHGSTFIVELPCNAAIKAPRVATPPGANGAPGTNGELQ